MTPKQFHDLLMAIKEMTNEVRLLREAMQPKRHQEQTWERVT